MTLLDFDRERETGGWVRVKYVLDQLLKIGRPRAKLLSWKQDDGTSGVLTEKEFGELKDWDENDAKQMRTWLDALESENVFFSYPLDIDFALLRRFPAAYHAAKSARGPRIPDREKDLPAYQKRIKAACQAVLKNEASKGVTYTHKQREAFIWYQHLFLGRGKPSTHILALNEIDGTDLWKRAPVRLKRLVRNVRKRLK